MPKEAKTFEEMMGTFGADFPHTEFIPDRFYAADMAEYRGDLNRMQINMRPVGLVEFRVRMRGASNTLDKVLCAYVAGVNLAPKPVGEFNPKTPKPFIAICDDLANGILTMPAMLPVENIIGYRIVEKIRQ